MQLCVRILRKIYKCNYMPIKFNLGKYTNNNYFIETGTYIGDGVKKAMEAGFKNIISIEFDNNRYLECKNMFKNNNNVQIVKGDSGEVLPDILKKINEPVTFFLDAHYCGDNAEISDKWCPLDKELQAIKNHKINTHTILIDDWRCMDNTHIDYSVKEEGIEVGFLGKQNCLERIKEINSDYNISFLEGAIENDVLCCEIKTKN